MVGIYKHIPQTGGGASEITIQTDTGTDPVGDTFTFTSSYFDVDGDSGTDTVDWWLGGAGTSTTNTVIGAAAGDAITSGVQNTIIGDNALTTASSASYQTAVGYKALESVTTATLGNVAVGWSAGGSITTGISNALLGISSGGGITTGNGNTAFGHNSLSNTATGTSRCLSLGNNSGLNNTGSDCVFLGTTAGKYNTANQKLIIDVADRGSEANQNNGAIIYGEFQSTATDQILATAGKFAVGNITPAGKAHVHQNEAADAIPALVLEQDDIDDTFINFIGTSAADGTRSISSDTTEDSAKFGAIRVEINGTTKWIRIYDNES